MIKDACELGRLIGNEGTEDELKRPMILFLDQAGPYLNHYCVERLCIIRNYLNFWDNILSFVENDRFRMTTLNNFRTPLKNNWMRRFDDPLVQLRKKGGCHKEEPSGEDRSSSLGVGYRCIISSKGCS
jgi:hypothetical protein